MINSRDGGALWCQIKVLKNNSRKETNKIKIEGQVQDFVNNPENAFYIFEGYVINGNQLIVTDTILDNTELLQMDLNNEGNIWNRKRINRAFEGIFRINRRVKKEHNIYIHVIAGSLLEIRLIN